MNTMIYAIPHSGYATEAPPRDDARNVPLILRFVRNVYDDNPVHQNATGEAVYKFNDEYYVVTPAATDGEYDLVFVGHQDPAVDRVAEAIEDCIHDGYLEIEEAFSKGKIEDIAAGVGGVFDPDECFFHAVRAHIDDWLEYRGPDEYVRGGDGTWRRRDGDDDDE